MSKKSIRAKRVSNYELFFDLSLVLAIGQLTGAMHLEEITVNSILAFVISNMTLLMVWVNEVFYYEKYGDSRRIDIFTVIALMFFLGNMALNFRMDFTSLYAGSPIVVSFNLLLIASYGVIALQYFLKGEFLALTEI